MKVRLHKISNQRQIAIYIPQGSKIKVNSGKKGHVILKVPYRATTQNRLVVNLDGSIVEAYID